MQRSRRTAFQSCSEAATNPFRFSSAIAKPLAELGVCERQIHNLVDQNLLEKVKLGTKTARITRSSVLKLAAQRATDNTPTAA